MSRIIAGRARGTQLRAPAGDRTRPTTDRVREALFSALAVWADGVDADPGDQLAGLKVLDLYAGSGAIGLEAASRGAARVVMVENHKPTAELVRRNIAATKLGDRAQVISSGVRSYLDQAPEPFDIVWLDPPYTLPAAEVDAVLGSLMGGWVGVDGLVVVERSRRDAPVGWPPGVTEDWTRRYGETQLYFGRTASPQEGQ